MSLKLICLAVLVLFTGCAAIGPPTVARDRFDYVNAISDSWKRQMLLNLAKFRYMDAPVFLDVTSVINQYSVEGQINLGATWFNPGRDTNQTVGGTGKYSDRPTITYSPLTGVRFTRSLMTPIPVVAILAMLQAGYPVDFIFRICVQTINGVENRFGGQMIQQTADPEFYQLLRTLKEIQDSGRFGIRMKKLKDGKEDVMMILRSKDTQNGLGEQFLVRQILGLDAEAQEFSVVYGSLAKNNREIAILTRSMLQIMVELASYIEVPPDDIAQGRVYGAKSTAPPDFPDLIRIQCDPELPVDVHVAVRYRGRWFWIDDRDVASKRMFSFIMLLFSLTETGERGGGPIVTVPTN
jgi:hypothetical protein